MASDRQMGVGLQIGVYDYERERAPPQTVNATWPSRL